MISPGIKLLHKPVGVTSFSLVQTWRARAAETPGRPIKFCHGGTLDPFATGLLLLLAGPATQLFDHLHDVPKTYEVVVRWGVETDNGDPLGKPVFQGELGGLSAVALDASLDSFLGWTDQIPPTTSAIRIDGERAYLKAHRGQTPLMPTVRVYLHAARWLDHDLPGSSRLRITVRGGFYVRSLIRDLGRRLGCGAHVEQLARTAIGPWTDPGPGRVLELQGRENLPWAATRILDDQEVGELRAARPVNGGRLLPPLWPLPDGFPHPRPIILGLHQDRVAFLLRAEETGRLAALVNLKKGL